ncbi:spondin-1-like isoform X3 [Vespa mandarinia]|uniref:spondin-1-like isoform X3 n=1 Tax=Vespa mandarinia TaxID=7446 RepID=UPI001610D577|nr:spondin-1-like isoform X3 [Vespa mandarinia]
MEILPGRILYYILLLFAITHSSYSVRCNRVIDGTTRPRSEAKEKYSFFMTLYNRSDTVYAYMPDTKYTVTIKSESPGPTPRKFTRFLISADMKNDSEIMNIGVFDIMDESISKFADQCANAVVEISEVPKEQVSVAWTSPSEGSGCILIRATILETPDTWYMDDSNLVLNICQDIKAEADNEGLVLDKCCACNEAKYEVTFEGLWSRNTHPKDFPSKGWLIRFSDVIGASHTVDYRFWVYDGIASIGLKQVAELGSTRRLESELKNQSEHIRTIIKARGISYPNVTGRTFAVFRVDRKHHLMSLVSMIDPSPDWIVGVSGLELCLENCSWIEYKELNLYPYDAGTDDGITYLSPNSPTEPQERIRRITSNYPNDSRSPFYDPSGLDMKPLAKLYLNRQRLYEKTCNNLSTKFIDSESCRVTSWSDWSECGVTCGKGNKLRQRRYHNETAAIINKCNISLTDRTTCYGEHLQCGNSGQNSGILDTEMCVLTNWSEWSSCSATCGQAVKSRSRNFKHKQYRKQCRNISNGPELEQTTECDTEPCSGEDGDEVRNRLIEENDENTKKDEEINLSYEGDDSEVEVIEKWSQKCPSDRYTEWSMWSPCSSSCGPGVKLRSRLDKKRWSHAEEQDDLSMGECRQEEISCVAEIESCDFSNEEAAKICSEPKMEGKCRGNVLRVYFNKHDRQCHHFKYTGCEGNRNNFPTKEDCYTVCGNYQRELKANLSALMKNFKVSLSSVLSYHIPIQEQHRRKTKRAQFGDTSELLQFKGLQAGSQVTELSEVIKQQIDCNVSEWGTWSPCVGCRGLTISTRTIITPAKYGGKSCPRKLLRKRKCRKIPPCSKQDNRTGTEISVDCKMTPWSAWTRCRGTCRNASQQRIRSVKVQPRGPNGRHCSTLVEFRNCTTLECP